MNIVLLFNEKNVIQSQKLALAAMRLNVNVMFLCIIKCCLWEEKKTPAVKQLLNSSHSLLFTFDYKINSWICLESCWMRSWRSWRAFHIERFSSSEGCDWKSAESDKAGLHTHTKTHQKNMLGMLTSTWHGIRFLYFTIRFDCVSASSNESWGLTHLRFFTAEKAHNPLTKKYLSMSILSLLFLSL